MPVQLTPLKNAVVESLSSKPFTAIADLTVEATTLSDEEGTTVYPDYGDEEDDNITNTLSLSLLGG